MTYGSARRPCVHALHTAKLEYMNWNDGLYELLPEPNSSAGMCMYACVRACVCLGACACLCVHVCVCACLRASCTLTLRMVVRVHVCARSNQAVATSVCVDSRKDTPELCLRVCTWSCSMISFHLEGCPTGSSRTQSSWTYVVLCPLFTFWIRYGP